MGLFSEKGLFPEKAGKASDVRVLPNVIISLHISELQQTPFTHCNVWKVFNL